MKADRAFLAVLGGFALLMLALVAMRPLLPIDETRYLSVAWEMRLASDPVHLTENGAVYTHKPPLLFWLMNIVWMVTGVSEFAARLVGPAAAVGCVAGTAALAQRMWPGDAGAGLRSALVLTAFPVFAIYGSATMFDALLTLAVLAGVAALWRIGQGAAGLRPWAAFGVAVAFGIYAKGPVILVHLVPVLLTMRIWGGEPPRAGGLLRGLLLALAVALGLVGLWLGPALLTGTAAFREELLWTQSAGRVAGGLAHDRPVWFLVALLPLLLFPWGWSWRLWRGVAAALPGDRALRLCALWAVSGLVLFSVISGKQAHYLIPEFPAVAMIASRALGRIDGSRGGSAGWILPAVVGMLSLAYAGGVIEPSGDLANLPPEWPVAVFGILCLLVAGAALMLPFVAGHLVAGAGLALSVHLLIAASPLYGQHDGHALAARLAAAERGGIAMTGYDYEAQFNFLARLTQPVAVPGTPEALQAWLAAHPEGLLFGRMGEVPVSAAPTEVFDYHGETVAIWPATAALATFRAAAPGG